MDKDCLNFQNVDGDIEIEHYPVGSVYSEKHPVVIVRYNGEATTTLIGIEEINKYFIRQRDLFEKTLHHVQEAYIIRKAIENKRKVPGF